jgi:hypothetical protein
LSDDAPAVASAARADAALKRMLLPMDASGRSRWAIRYALARHQGGEPVDATLLVVGEPVTDWQVLRFRTHEEVARFQAERARYLMEEAAQPLVRSGIPCRTLFREGDLAFEILDAAEQFDCTEIVLPAPPPRLLALLSRDTVREVLRRKRGVPVVLVDENGLPNGHRRN